MVKVHAHIETLSDVVDYVWRHPIIMALCLLMCAAVYVAVVVRKSVNVYTHEDPISPDPIPVDGAPPVENSAPPRPPSGLRMRSIKDDRRI